MKVNFYATLRGIVGEKTVDFGNVNGMTAKQLLDAMLNRFPALRNELIDEKGHLYGHVHYFINGRDVQFLEDNLDTILKPDDIINIFPAVGGGQVITSLANYTYSS